MPLDANGMPFDPHDARRTALLRKAGRDPNGEAQRMAKLFIPGPVNCAPSVLQAAAAPPVDHRGPEFAAVLARIASGLQPIFGTSQEIVILGCSGTGGLEAAVTNSFSPGDKLLACPVGVFGRRFANISARYGCDVEILETPLGRRLEPERLAARLRDGRSQAIAGILLTHNETSTGVQNDMAALCAAIGDHPATVIVDSVSGLGASPFAMDAWRCDIVVGASQKALAAPPGLAMLAIGERAWNRMERAGTPRFYFDLRAAREQSAAGQTPWTPPVGIAFALDAALARYHDEGPANAFARHDRYARAIRAFADTAELQLLSHSDAHSNTVVAISPPRGVDADALRSQLRERYGVVIGGGQAELRGKLWRIGTMGCLAGADIVEALQAFSSALDAFGHAAPAKALEGAESILADGFVSATR